MAQAKSIKYRGYVIRESRGDWYVDKDGKVILCVWSQKDGKRNVDRLIAELEANGPRESNPFRMSAKDPSDMSAAEINRELDRISAEDSKVNQEFIDAGRGHEKYWDILKKDDPLSRKALALASRRHKLKIEIERRAGPGMSRLPRGFGPRKSNPVKKRANDLTPEAMEGYTGAPLKYLYSSPSWYAYKIGEHFRASGRPEPSDVRMGRGYSVNVRDMTFSFGKNEAITRVK